jgi:uncharacterized protein (DUF362 family)
MIRGQLKGDIMIVVAEHDDKQKALDTVLEKSAFFDHVNAVIEKAQKSKKEALIVIKPNIMVTYHRDHIHVGTDPALVEHLITRIAEEGYHTIAVVESKNIYTSWFPKRTVERVATTVGYTGDGYTLVDLTEEAEPYNYGGHLGDDFVGTTWKNADYRISFAKNKTHLAAVYTLSMKNMFGTLPTQYKYEQYHKTFGWEYAVMDVLRNFPPDFAFIDAFWSSDGMNGCVLENLTKTKTLIGGSNYIAVDWVGALKMGVDPMESPLMRMAVAQYGKPVYDVDGSLELYSPWKNAPMTVAKIMLALEKTGIISFLYHLMFMRLMDPEFR